MVVPSMAVTSRPFHRAGDPQLRVAALRVQLEDPPHGLLSQQPAGLGERTAGRDLRAGLEPQAGQPERLRQHTVVAVAGEQAGDQHAGHGHLRGQHPVITVPGRRFPQRPHDHAVGEQVFQQSLPVQLAQPFCPETQPGRDAGRQAIRDGIVLSRRHGLDRRQLNEHGRLGRQQSSRRTDGVNNPVPTRSFVLFQGPPARCHDAAVNLPPDRNHRRKTGQQGSYLQKLKGSGVDPLDTNS